MAATVQALRGPASFKLDAGTRKNVAFLSTALDVDKSTVIERAVRLLAEHHADDLRHNIDQASAAIDRGGDWALAEALTSVKRDVRARGGRPRKHK